MPPSFTPPATSASRTHPTRSSSNPVSIVRSGGVISRVGVPQYIDDPIGWSFFGDNTTLTGGPAPARSYIEQLLPALLDGKVNPGKVFDRTVSIEDTPQGYAAMDARQALKVMIKP